MQRKHSVALLVIAGAALVQCSSSRDYYRDTYEPAGSTYENHAADFSMRIPSHWKVYAHYEEFPPQFRQLADELRADGGEIAMVAHDPARLSWVRVLIEDTDVPLENYIELIQMVNSGDLGSGPSNYSKIDLNGQPAIEWQYELPLQGVDVRYLEYQIKRNIHNVRVTFWTASQVYAQRYPEFVSVAGTIR